jgi:hypothetical protein
MKSLALYAAMVLAAFSIQHALVKMTRDADTPVLAIAQAQANQPFGAQISPSQLAAIQSRYAATIASDRAALAQAEQQATP